MRVIFWWNKKKVSEICFPLLLEENLNWFWPWIIVRPFLPLQLGSYSIFVFRTRTSKVIPTKWCKTFETCTWIISEFDRNLPICYNITIRRYDNPENFSSLSCTDQEKSLFKKLARSDWKLWNWRFKVNLHDFKNFIFLGVLILEG